MRWVKALSGAMLLAGSFLAIIGQDRVLFDLGVDVGQFPPSSQTIDAGDPSRLTLIENPIHLDPHTDYIVKLRLGTHPEFRLDFMSGQYDHPEQETVFSRDDHKAIENRYFSFNSQESPARDVGMRLFFFGDGTLDYQGSKVRRIPLPALTLGLLGPFVLAFSGWNLLLGASGIRDSGLAAFLLTTGFSLSFFVSGLSDPLAGDNRNYGMVTESILLDGNTELSEFSARIAKNLDYGIVRDHGRLYNFFPAGPSLALIPAYSMMRAWGSRERVEVDSARITLSLMFAASLAGVFLLARSFPGTRREDALLAALAFGICSEQFSLNAVSYWSHSPEVLCMVLAMITARSTSKWGTSLSPLFLATAYIMRPTAALLAPFLTIYVLSRKARRMSFLVGLLIAVSLAGLLNHTLYGQWTPPYASASRLNFASLKEALLGNLFSPNRGALVFMPWILFSLLGAFLTLRRRKDFFYLLLFFHAVSHLLVVSCFPHWWGGFSYGPRLLAEAMAPLALLLIPVAQEQGPVSKALRPLLAASLIVGQLVQISGLTQKARMWNADPVSVDQKPSRIWDWNDMQILRFIDVKTVR